MGTAVVTLYKHAYAIADMFPNKTCEWSASKASIVYLFAASHCGMPRSTQYRSYNVVLPALTPPITLTGGAAPDLQVSTAAERDVYTRLVTHWRMECSSEGGATGSIHPTPRPKREGMHLWKNRP